MKSIRNTDQVVFESLLAQVHAAGLTTVDLLAYSLAKEAHENRAEAIADGASDPGTLEDHLSSIVGADYPDELTEEVYERGMVCLETFGHQ